LSIYTNEFDNGVCSFGVLGFELGKLRRNLLFNIKLESPAILLPMAADGTAVALSGDWKSSRAYVELPTGGGRILGEPKVPQESRKLVLKRRKE